MLILYPATLLSLFIRSGIFCVEFLRFSIYMSSVYRDNFTSSLPILIPFITFFPPVAVARTSNIMLDKSGESGHPCLISDFIGKASSFSPLSIFHKWLLLQISHICYMDG
uniref:Uncharacterized protein n=1 Tax=Sus scrofa TaxID=9823 RepID=A0A8D1E8G6_PIG